MKLPTYFIALITLITSSYSLANDSAPWEALKQGKAIAIMRHAIAPQGNENSAFSPDTCAAQRNLSVRGRNQANQIGELFRTNGISQAKVYSSSLCRCIDTGILLGFGAPQNLPAINSFYGDDNGATQTIELNRWIKSALSTQSQTNILVTHGFNISGLTGNFVSQGDILIIGLEGDDLVTLLQTSTYVP